MIKWLILFLLPLSISILLSQVVIRYLGRYLVDTPNLRSSHQIPTPRGGGIAILVSMIFTVAIAVGFAYMDGDIFFWFLIPVSLISVLGICDDFFNLSVKVRLTTQFILASIAVLLLSEEDVGLHHSLQESILIIAMILFVTWMANLYNFMDGINGLAALEAITVCIGMIAIYTAQKADHNIIHMLLIIMGCACGFLVYNFPTAKLFMGDSGSLLLGLSFGILAVESVNQDYAMTAAWLIMLAVFVVDATYTLLYRIISNQAFSQAHRSHVYQKCSRIYESHTRVTLTIIAVNGLWLFPLAVATSANILHPLLGILIAYLPLIFIAWKYNAGSPD